MEKYWRKSYQVDAVRVTAENIREVAPRVSGKIVDMGILHLDGPNGKPCIELIVRDKHHRSWKSFAYIGDWIVRVIGESASFQVYTDEIFTKRFHSHTDRLTEDEKYARIFGLVVVAMHQQDEATYHQDTDGMALVAIKITKQILNEL